MWGGCDVRPLRVSGRGLASAQPYSKYSQFDAVFMRNVALQILADDPVLPL